MACAFFLYCYGEHRDLHSFPTRRSSDLGATLVVIVLLSAAGPPIDWGISEWRGSPFRAVLSLASPVYVFAIAGDRKSTRLNSSHGYISYAVFCLKKKI